MIDSKFVDDGVIKALECFALEKDFDLSHCIGCIFENEIVCCENASKGIAEVSLALVNKQKAEIERLEAECERQYEQAEADIHANIANGGTSCHWCIDKTKEQAIKEFIHRLKKELILEKYIKPDQINNIDNITKEIIKEMMGD